MVDVFDNEFQNLGGVEKKANNGDLDQDDPQVKTVQKITAKGPNLNITNVQFPGKDLELSGDFAPQT